MKSVLVPQFGSREEATSNFNEFSRSHFPPELLSKIFLDCSFMGFGSLNPSAPPLLFGQICSFWRQVAYCQTPKLWTKLIVANLHLHCTKDGFLLMKEWIARAHPHAASISFHYDSKNPNPAPSPAVFARRFIQVAGLVRSITLILPPSYFKALKISPTSSMPLLEEMNLFLTDMDSDRFNLWMDYPTPPPLCFDGCPRLNEVTLNSQHFTGILSMDKISSIPWSRLTKVLLTDTRFTITEARDRLYQATNLVEFKLCEPDAINDPDTSSLPISIHPKLQKLDLWLCGNTKSIRRFLQPFTFPALTSLSVGTDGLQILSFSPVIALQERSHFSLTSLSLCDLRLKCSDLINFLHSVRNLKIFELDGCQILQPVFVQEFVHSSRDTPFVPMLERLRIFDRRSCVEDDLILDMLESRRLAVNSNHKLEKVSMIQIQNLKKVPSAAASARAKALLNSGLSLKCPPLVVGSHSGLWGW